MAGTVGKGELNGRYCREGRVKWQVLYGREG